MTTAKEFDNPWGLTPSEATTMDAMIKHCCAKKAAESIYKSTSTIRDHTKAAARKMKCRGTVIKKYLLWDRFRQEQKAKAASEEQQVGNN